MATTLQQQENSPCKRRQRFEIKGIARKRSENYAIDFRSEGLGNA